MIFKKQTLEPFAKVAMPIDWMTERMGWTEFDHTKELAKYWKLTNVPDYDTVIGSKYAWCALGINAALHDTGYKGNGRADAHSFVNYGTSCELKPGCIVVIQTSIGYHVTFCFRIVDKDTFIGRGSNQNNSICDEVFNRHSIVHTCWPIV